MIVGWRKEDKAVSKNYHDALEAGFKEIENREAIQKVLDNELMLKATGDLGYCQGVIDSCQAALREMDK